LDLRKVVLGQNEQSGKEIRLSVKDGMPGRRLCGGFAVSILQAAGLLLQRWQRSDSFHGRGSN
jgi:hypothetical protein